MQRIHLTRSLLTEFSRCEKSFILSLFWHGLDNDSLAQKGHGGQDTNEVYNMRREMMMNIRSIAQGIAQAGGVSVIDCETGDVQEKVDKTWDIISSGDTAVIVDGALEGSDIIVPFSVMVIRPDGLWEVYHQSTKGMNLLDAKSRHKTLTAATKDAAPLMYVLAKDYANYVARFAVVGANTRYLSPYPDPETGTIVIDPNEAMFCLDLDIMDDRIGNYLGGEDPIGDIENLLSILAENPFWIPECEMGSQCNSPYLCPHYTYCQQQKQNDIPNSVSFFMPHDDASKLEANGYYTMDDVLDLSYDYPALMDIPTQDDPEKTFDISEIGLRELRSYEQSLLNVENEVAYVLN